jgi:translation initiation factor 1A
MENYGEFEEVNASGGTTAQLAGQASPPRVRLPKEGELIGVVIQKLGGNRMEVLATDGKARNCRVPGKFKRSMWLRPKDVVLIKPWIDDNNKADIIFQYNSSAIIQLRKKRMLDNLKNEF